MFKGCCTALITPFEDNGEINYEAFAKIIEDQIQAGVSALLFLGTTGESPTLSHEEKVDVVKFAVKQVNKRAPVLVGAGSNSTKTAIANTKEFASLGVDGLLMVTPYYNKATQEGLYLHYKAIAENVNAPIILYNVPSRTGVNLAPETIIRLSKIDNIVGLKQASTNIQELMDIVDGCDKDFSIYSGEDSFTYVMMSLGAKGVISVASNIYPHFMSSICENYFNGNKEKSLEMQLKINPVVKELFSEVNPIPIKHAMNFLGYNAGVPRMPLTEMAHKKELEEKIKSF